MAPPTPHDPEAGRSEAVARPSSSADEDSLAQHKMAVEMGVEGAYERKVALINRAIKHEIGFGKFQIWLFALTGMGWFVDNIWFEALALALPQVQLEFRVGDGLGPGHIQFATLALYVGLFFGATVWGTLADVIGRRLSWNVTLFLSSVFGFAAGAAPSFVAFGSLLACLGLGVGGNLPVDGAMFLEFVPGEYQWLLTLLSVFWSFGQLFAAFIGWAFVTNYRCSEADACTRSNNAGWRYTFYLLGGVTFLMWVARFIIYPIPESPKYLIAKGRDAEALEVIKHIAAQNGKTTTLTLERLRAAGEGYTEERPAAAETVPDLADTKEKPKGEALAAELTSDAPAVRSVPVSVSPGADSGWRARPEIAQLRRSLAHMDASHISALFSSTRMGFNTVLVCFLWGLIGLAYPLYNANIALYLQNSGADYGSNSQAEQYRQLVIIAACGIPGSLIAAAMVELPYAGRRGSMAIFTALTGVFLFAFTRARTPEAILGFNCATSLTQNAMYGVLYAITYEVFPAPHRGSGDGLAMGTQRVFGVIAPLVAAFAGAAPTTPIYVSASFFIGAAILMLMLPYEPRGMTAL